MTLDLRKPALVLAPMDGITDAPMRALQGEIGAFTFAVSEFIRVSVTPIPAKVFRKEVPELASRAITPTGLPVQVQILGGDPERMAISASNAIRAGATAIDINFGCPAPTVNRHDGGASLLNHPTRIREIVAAVRGTVPPEIPVSAKLRLGWDDVAAIHENADMAVEGGASWITIHARTRSQGYNPPVFWEPIGLVRERVGVPVVANGDIWTIDEFHQCREETGCSHFMLGRCALASPNLSSQIARELGLPPARLVCPDWETLLRGLVRYTAYYEDRVPQRTVLRLKQWMKFAQNHGEFEDFDRIKRAETVEEFFVLLASAPTRALKVNSPLFVGA